MFTQTQILVNDAPTSRELLRPSSKQLRFLQTQASILRFMARNRGQLFTPQQIWGGVFGEEEPYFPPELRGYMARLLQISGPDNEPLITTETEDIPGKKRGIKRLGIDRYDISVGKPPQY